MSETRSPRLPLTRDTRHRWFAAMLAAFFLCGASCARWSQRSAEPSELPKARMSPDTVVLEITRISVPGESVAELQTIWASLDEMRGPPGRRGMLAAHGWRLGVGGVAPPEAIPRLVERSAGAEQAGEFIRVSSRRLQSRAGNPAVEAIAARRSRVDVLLKDREGAVRGETFFEAQAAVEIRTQPLEDGSVELTITPLLQHGELKNRRVVQNGLWQYVLAPEERRWSEFKIQERLQLGQAIYLSAGLDASGAGGQFFAHPADQGRREVIMIRLAQAQRDEIFELDR